MKTRLRQAQAVHAGDAGEPPGPSAPAAGPRARLPDLGPGCRTSGPAAGPRARLPDLGPRLEEERLVGSGDNGGQPGAGGQRPEAAP